MRKKESEANSEVRTAAEKARLETLDRQAAERSQFLAGDGIVIRRYNKEATKVRREYLRKNRRQLEQARKAKTISDRRKAKAAGSVPGRKKKTFSIGTAEKIKANEKWATNQARYILHRIGNKQSRPAVVQDNAELKEQS